MSVAPRGSPLALCAALAAWLAVVVAQPITLEPRTAPAATVLQPSD